MKVSCIEGVHWLFSLAMPGNRATLFQMKAAHPAVPFNALYKKCCTWSVNFGQPGRFELNQA